MATKKEGPESLPGCLVTIFWGYLIIILCIHFFDDHSPNAEVSPISRAAIILYTLLVVYALLKTKFSGPKDRRK
jgi:hypothetical protein